MHILNDKRYAGGRRSDFTGAIPRLSSEAQWAANVTTLVSVETVEGPHDWRGGVCILAPTNGTLVFYSSRPLADSAGAIS